MSDKGSDKSTKDRNSAGFEEALGRLRKRIDDADDEIIALLNRRADCAKAIGQLKASEERAAYAPGRERELLTRLVGQNSGPLSRRALELIYKEVISACLSLEKPMKVAYLGPEGTFTHAATKRHFGLSTELTPKLTIGDVFDNVERRQSAFGVVPIENSTEGVVTHTLDAFMTSSLYICAEVMLEVSHHLLTVSGEAPNITKVYSHPQALAQCREWLERHMPGVPLIDVSSTARAAQLAAEDSTAAAIAGDLAASIHGLQIAHSNIEDHRANLTRFLVVGSEAANPTANDRTSLMFALKDAPGVLYDALAPFSLAGINLSRIESRPSRQRAWEYLFFIDLVGHQADESVKGAIEELNNNCVFMKVLGSYPRGHVDTEPSVAT